MKLVDFIWALSVDNHIRILSIQDYVYLDGIVADVLFNCENILLNNAEVVSTDIEDSTLNIYIA